MSRSTEIPFADDPLAEDPLLAELRDARPQPPDDLLDPHAPANAAILAAIVGEPAPRRGHRRMVVRLVAAAAVAATVAAVVVVWPFGSPEPTAADVVRRAVAASGAALDSGRALVTVTTETTPERSLDDLWPGYHDRSEDTYEYRFAGDDVAVGMVLGADGEGYPGERRIVDGEMYWHAGPDPSTPWFHHVDGGPSRSDWTGDPRSLLGTLEARAGFELVGDDTVDGIDITHLRSTTPSYFDPQELGLGQAMETTPGALTGLDVWVDGDGVVRRIDFEVTHRSEMGVMGEPDDPMETLSITQVTTATVRFVDIGVPNTVEAPATFCEVTDEMMADPPPPGADVC